MTCRGGKTPDTILRVHPSKTIVKNSSVKFFAEELPKLSGKKVLLVTNPSGIGSNPDKLQEKFKEHKVEIKSLLGLEHGFLGLEEDFSNSPVTIDSTFKLPIYHIYKLKPHEINRILKEVDVVVFDVQDMGMRCYTYLSVLKRLMDNMGDSDTELILLDHVNIGMEIGPRGNEVEKGYENFAGEFPLLLFTGLSIGESAIYYNKEYLNDKVKIKVIPVENYTRSMKFEKTGLTWNTPSPNLPTLDSARNYMSLVLLEGINVSVGRGTQAPFIYFGAPWMDDPELLAEKLEKVSEGDYYFQSVFFKPTFSKYKDKICRGLRLTLVNSDYDPIKLSYNLIKVLRQKYKSDFSWAGGKTPMIDLLWGGNSFRKAIESGMSYKDFKASYSLKEKQYKEKLEKYQIYKP
jgi:uncharacterized protein YbbC (DUF1343 family)